MQLTRTPLAEELLRSTLARHPGESPEQVRRDAASSPKTTLTLESFHTWLHQFTAYSDRIPSMPGETFSREMIYQDHD